MGMRPEIVKRLAHKCGFELAGVASAAFLPEVTYYHQWVRQGMAGEMGYLTDNKRSEIRADPRSLLPSARSIVCVGKLYNGPQPYSTHFDTEQLAWISRYAWGDDYHVLLREGLRRLVQKLSAVLSDSFEWKICVDTAPLLERACARRAGLGWIGKNTCLINQQMGSWFFLGELLVSLELEPDAPPPDRCGTCTRCIDACPTDAIVPTGLASGPTHAVDSRLCISYFTIEFRGLVPEHLRTLVGNHVFGCDICQDVCPWNRKAPVTEERALAGKHLAPPLEKLAALSEEEFQDIFGGTPVMRSRYRGFMRNVAVAMGNTRRKTFQVPLEKLVQSADPIVSEHARWALQQLEWS